MANTRGDLRADVRTELKKDPNGRIWGDSELNNYINKAYLKVQRDGNFQWTENQGNETFSTVSGTQEYAKPTDLGKLQLVRYNGTRLIKTTKVAEKARQATFVGGTPSKYYVFGAFIGFDVIPNGVGTVDVNYQKRLAAFTADTDESAFNDDFDMAIAKYAAFLAWSAIDGKQSTAQAQLNEYQLELDTLFAVYIFDDLNDLTFNLQRGGQGITQPAVLDR